MRLLALLIGILLLSCSQGQRVTVDTVPDRLNPPVPNALVIELDVPDWYEICVRMQPAAVHKYWCITAGQLRQAAQPTLRANN